MVEQKTVKSCRCGAREKLTLKRAEKALKKRKTANKIKSRSKDVKKEENQCKKNGEEDESKETGEEDESKETDEVIPESQLEIQKRAKATLQRAKRTEDNLMMMFTSSIDPYEKPSMWWEKPHIKYAFSHPPVRSRLEMLMGSNVVRLTDRKYMLRLMSRIRQDHESQQQTRIQERKTHELMRTKKMILNRFIPVQEAPAEIRQYPLFQLYLYCDAIIEQRRKKRASKKVRIPKSLYRLLYPEKLCEVEDAAGDEAEEQKVQVPMKEVMIDSVPEMVPLTKEELEDIERQKEVKEDIEKGYMFSKEEYDNLHYEADAVKRLKETRTVDEMYAKAHEIVGVLFSFAGNEKRKRCARDEETGSTTESDVGSKTK